ncbi:MAG TPA: response regulator [Oligoflexus sp.]|uniref:ATP-binding response regulator n=1 Tax=Oligoflexus sp. TaxID=1971216 RepID=UPI002D5F81AF|nr:response regulator [Oligoflexus sp.]HYX38333.1 response regulator [Oligoflexus sp.]
MDFLIMDTGIGVAAGMRGKLFQMFSQADGSLTRKFGGVGLGLQLSKKVAGELGGDVEILHTMPGQGSTFRLRITDHRLDSGRVNTNLQQALGNGTKRGSDFSELKGKKVLCVEDHIDHQRLIDSTLDKYGIQTVIAHDGHEGIERALSGEFDVVLMDILMPHLNGNEATQMLRSKGYQKPILALSAQGRAGDRERSMLAGCNEYLTKPIDIDHLLQTIAKFTAGFHHTL